MRVALIALLSVLCLLLFFGLAQANDRIAVIERQLCAFIFEEDGSASMRTDDLDRFRCMKE